MHLTWTKDRDTDCIKFHGSVSSLAMEQLDLDSIDQLMLQMPVKTPADFLLNLEMLFRRFAEQTQIGKNNGNKDIP